MLAGGLVNGHSKKQAIFPQSFFGAVLVALSMGIRESLGLKNFEDALSKTLDRAVVKELMTLSNGEDNKRCISSAHYPICTHLSKYIDVKYQRILNTVQKGIIRLHYVSTDMTIADLFTKTP